MPEALSLIGLIVSIFIVVHIVHKCRAKKRTTTARRVPYRLDSTNSARLPEQRRKPTPINHRGITAIIPPSNDYMNYRYCPDCHSRNKEGRQVIYKINQTDFECSQCGRRFSI